MGKSIKDIIYDTGALEGDNECETNPTLHIVGTKHKLCMLHFKYTYNAKRSMRRNFNTCNIIGRKYNNCINYYKTDIFYYKLRYISKKLFILSYEMNSFR